MKYRFLVFFIFFSLVTCVANAQLPGEYSKKTGMWDFPVKPGTEEWKKFKSYQERVNACQIPEDVLFSLSTEELADLCLTYLPFSFIFAFNDMNQGFDKLYNEFNGIRELFKRKDVSKELLNQYQAKTSDMSVLDKTDSNTGKGDFLISISVLEVLLACCQLQDNAKEILQSLVVGYEKKTKYADYFKGRGFRTNFYSRAHVIFQMDRSLVERVKPAMFSGMADERAVDAINELSYQLIK